MNYDMMVGDGLVLFDGPAIVNGANVQNVRLWFPLVSSDLRLRWVASEDVECPDDAVIAFEHPELGVCSADGFVLDAVGFGHVESTVIGDSTALVDQVVSGWVNLPNLGPTSNRFDDCSTVIEAAGWNLGLSAIQPSIGRTRHARRQGLPVYVSHGSVLTRVDGARFSADAALRALFAFQTSLSFVLGRFVSPIAPSGYNDKLSWILTPAWYCDDGSLQEGIIYSSNAEDFVDAVERLATELLSGTQAEPVRYLALHAILAHTAGRAEQRLMTAQAGLEFCAWLVLVTSQEFSANELQRLSASDRIDLAVTRAQIPNDIPDELAALIDQATNPTESDVPTNGPGVGVWIRNRISHPKDPWKPYEIDGAVFQASLLLLEYLELLILHHLDYRGAWRRRYPPGRWAHESEPVPWT